jgi:hypothetical protein
MSSLGNSSRYAQHNALKMVNKHEQMSFMLQNDNDSFKASILFAIWRHAFIYSYEKRHRLSLQQFSLFIISFSTEVITRKTMAEIIWITKRQKVKQQTFLSFKRELVMRYETVKSDSVCEI